MLVVTRRLIKSLLIFSAIALTITILLALVYIIMNESPLSKYENKNLFLDSILKAKYCESKKFSKYTEVLIKCGVAFLSGCLLSEMKFLKSGII
jgi:hypothetical protein